MIKNKATLQILFQQNHQNNKEDNIQVKKPLYGTIVI